MGVVTEYYDLVNPDNSPCWSWRIEGIHDWPKQTQVKIKWLDFGIRPYPYAQKGFNQDSAAFLELISSDQDADGEIDDGEYNTEVVVGDQVKDQRQEKQIGIDEEEVEDQRQESEIEEAIRNEEAVAARGSGDQFQ